MLNWLRALHFLCFNPGYFDGISSELILDTFPLITHDPYFILPIITFLLNYVAISVAYIPILDFSNYRKGAVSIHF